MQNCMNNLGIFFSNGNWMNDWRDWLIDYLIRMDDLMFLEIS